MPRTFLLIALAASAAAVEPGRRLRDSAEHRAEAVPSRTERFDARASTRVEEQPLAVVSFNFERNQSRHGRETPGESETQLRWTA